jgi:hypothetical protein
MLTGVRVFQAEGLEFPGCLHPVAVKMKAELDRSHSFSSLNPVSI